MKILINDHAGHPFQVQLSRALARRGHQVLHTFTGALQTPRGALYRHADDPPSFAVASIPLKHPFDRYGLITRFLQERELGRALRARVLEFCPDAVISANTPLVAQEALLAGTRKIGGRFVFWLQDLLGIGIRNNLRKKLPLLGGAVGAHFIRMEQRLLAGSDAVVAITEDFLPLLAETGLPRERMHVIHNWAPIEDLPPQPKANPWSCRHGLHETFCFLYSGTLGMKHNPERLIQLARLFQDDPRVRIVAITEGLGADYLAAAKERLPRPNLTLLPFQPFEELPQVLGAADVLVALLEPDAGVFAVPSKVLSYFCARRPLLLAVPPENLAARIVRAENAGIVVAPGDPESFLGAARRFRDGEALRLELAANGRRYAERQFDIETIADRFESIIRSPEGP